MTFLKVEQLSIHAEKEEGDIRLLKSVSLEMEKALNQMPNASGMKAQLVLEINIAHPVAEKLKTLFVTDQEKLKDYAKLLYAQGCLISGKSIDDPAELSKLICDLM